MVLPPCDWKESGVVHLIDLDGCLGWTWAILALTGHENPCKEGFLMHPSSHQTPSCRPSNCHPNRVGQFVYAVHPEPPMDWSIRISSCGAGRSRPVEHRDQVRPDLMSFNSTLSSTKSSWQQVPLPASRAPGARVACVPYLSSCRLVGSPFDMTFVELRIMIVLKTIIDSEHRLVISYFTGDRLVAFHRLLTFSPSGRFASSKGPGPLVCILTTDQISEILIL